MENHETKEWMISRIDYKHDCFLEELSILEGRTDKTSEDIFTRVKNGRNYVFSVVGVILTILLGLLSANLISPSEFYLYLGIDLVSGFITFIITNKISAYFTAIFSTVSQIYVDAQGKISYSRNYFTNLTVNHEKLQVEDLKNYSTFVPVLLCATLVPQFIILSELSRSKFLNKQDADALKNTAKELQAEIDNAYTLSETITSAILPAVLVTYTKTRFAEYKKFNV